MLLMQRMQSKGRERWRWSVEERHVMVEAAIVVRSLRTLMGQNEFDKMADAHVGAVAKPTHL